MSDVDWDADDFEPEVPAVKSKILTEKWAGEDEDDDIKDNWDDEDEEEKPADETVKAVQVKKKTTKEKIAEREAKRAEELEKRRLEQERLEDMTPEELAAEKARQQKIQEDSDLELAKLTFGESEKTSGGGEIDDFRPDDLESFTKFGELLRAKITQYEKSPHYVGFLEALFRDVTLGLESEDIKKLGSVLTVLSNEKAKQNKPAKGKKKSKQKASLQVSKDNDFGDYGGYDDAYDDFI